MLHCSSKGSEVPLWVIIYHENFAERDWAPAKFLVYIQAIPTEAPQTREQQGRQRQDRSQGLGREVWDTLHSVSKVRFMDTASPHLGRHTESQPSRAKVQNKSQVSLGSPRAELKEYTALFFWDQALQLE